MFSRKVPLAWQNLTHDKMRLAIAVAGIGFAVLLMFMQMGFQNALMDSTVELIRQLDADLLVMSSDRYTFSVQETFTRRRMEQIRLQPGVDWAEPLYIELNLSQWKNVENNKLVYIRVMGMNPHRPLFDLPGVQQQARLLIEPGTALADERSKSDYGPLETGVESTVNGRRVKIIGMFSLGADFINDGNLIVSDLTFRDLFGFPGSDRLDSVDLGLVKLAEGADAEELRAALAAKLPRDVQVLTKQQFVEQEQEFWATSTPIGFVFRLGTVMGFVVGVIVCYQVLSTDIADHLNEFATLKAMGYSSFYFFKVVLQEALLLSILAYLPGVLVSMLLYSLIAWLTGLQLALTPGLLGAVLSFTVIMCVASGCMAINKLLEADPAELF